MRRLNRRRREWFRRRARREARRHTDRGAGTRGAVRHQAFLQFDNARRALPTPNFYFDERPGFCILRPPATLDLASNYNETLAFLMQVRWRSPDDTRHPVSRHPLRLFFDFAALRTIAPATGLVLAAEIDRRRLSLGSRPRSHDADWHPDVRAYFDEAGLFDLLGIEPQVETVPSDRSPLRAVRFVRGRSVKGEIGSELRDRLERLCGTSIGPRRTVYEAISEAIANTRHAYPRDAVIWPNKTPGRWWAAGTWNSAENIVSLQLYDQGVGIPATLPRSGHWSDIARMVGLGDRLHPERRDDRLIEAALQVGRTSTGEPGRGKGLAEMATWVDKLESGFLRITSGKGSIIYRPGGAIRGTSHVAPFFGTLIEWEFGLGG